MSLRLLWCVVLLGCATAEKRPVSVSAEGAVLHRIEIRSETLPSGFRVVVARVPPMPGLASRIYVTSYILRGSLQEDRLGWAHMMEHIAANNRPTIAGPQPPEGVKPIESNALTRPYYTSFVRVVPPAMLPSVIHDRLAKAGRIEAAPAVFDQQRVRVLAELERDTQGRFPAYKALVQLALGRSPVLADEIASVEEATNESLAAAMVPLYHPRDAVLVVVGDIDVAQTLASIRAAETTLRLSEVAPPATVGHRDVALATGASSIVTGQNRSDRPIAGAAWRKPPLGHPDQLPLLIADQLLLGRGESVEDPTRSDASPLGTRLAQRLGSRDVWDGRAGTWGAPDLVDTGDGVQAVVFGMDRDTTPDEVRTAVREAVAEIRRDAMSDADIERAREALARFYERWLLEPTYRILGDHLMAWVATGRNPDAVKQIPEQIRNVTPEAVRAAFDRHVVGRSPVVVVLPRVMQ